ncbi:hypothetical protein BKA69DRAFT_365583 [Paraphysoderma sedebokerense]|nr:hypothetical protein BKA69DRAFT_365583 [Paraphysoderma sedebokerense]
MIRSLLEDLKVKISCYSLPPGDTQSLSNQATTDDPQTEEVNLDQEDQKEISDKISVEQAQENIEQSIDKGANSLSDNPSVDTPNTLDAPSVFVKPAKSGTKLESFDKIESLAADIMTLIDKSKNLLYSIFARLPYVVYGFSDYFPSCRYFPYCGPC